LARRLAAAGIGFTMADNAFAKIDDWTRAAEPPSPPPPASPNSPSFLPSHDVFLLTNRRESVR
jgi:hypothetical protein